MDLLPDETQQQVADQTGAFLSERLPLARLRSAEPAAGEIDDAAWAEIVNLGWLALGLNEEAGGVGFSLAEEALVMREVGRQAVSVSLFATMMAAHVAQAAGDYGLVGELVSGEKRAGWLEGHQVFAGRGADVWVSVTSERARLIDPHSADACSDQTCLDEFTHMSQVGIDSAKEIASVDESVKLFDHAAVLVAAQLVGVAEAARDLSADYAKERQQFGKPIGVFQGVKHPCADMAVRCEAAWSQTSYAALALRDGHADASRQVSAAKAVAGEAGVLNGEACILVHGGIGFTSASDAHVLVKRARLLRFLAGSDRDHLRRLLDEPIVS